jgi:hypothetical protein
MKRIQKFVAINVIAAFVGTGIPAMAAQNGHDIYSHGGMQYQSADHRGDRGGNDSRNREFRSDDRGDRNRRDYDGRDYDGAYGNGYAPTPVYRSAPVYDNGYYYERSHNGRAAAIIGGSAAAGALIGAAAGHGQGAVIGAVIGGIAGAAVTAAADHQHR